MENMSVAVLDSICESYKSDKDLIATILHYLYKTSTDVKMHSQIHDVMTDMNYCIECGEKLISYEWKEVHDELEGNPYEYRYATFCHKCDKWEIEDLKAKVIN